VLQERGLHLFPFQVKLSGRPDGAIGIFRSFAVMIDLCCWPASGPH